jgi:hypothetical protein
VLRLPRTTPRPIDIPLHLCLWLTTYFLVYHHVWEHHYVMLLPVFSYLYWRTGSRAVLVLFGCIALWTPYILVDPRGWANWDISMYWRPLEPRWMDVAYHASKAAPCTLLWCYIAGLILRRPDAAGG